MRWILTEAAGVGTEDREESLSLCLVPAARPLLGNPATAASDHQPAAVIDNTRCHYTGTSCTSHKSESVNERQPAVLLEVSKCIAEHIGYSRPA